MERKIEAAKELIALLMLTLRAEYPISQAVRSVIEDKIKDVKKEIGWVDAEDDRWVKKLIYLIEEETKNKKTPGEKFTAARRIIKDPFWTALIGTAFGIAAGVGGAAVAKKISKKDKGKREKGGEKGAK